MLPHRLLYLIQVALAVVQQNNVSAFSSIAPRAKIRHAPNAARLAGSKMSVGGFPDDLPSDNDDHKSSHIVYIKSSNIAGMVNDGDDADIQVDFGPDACLVAVTGESGSGKSLLVSKAIDLVTGGKVVSSLIPPRSGDNLEQENTASVELTVNLHEPQLSAVSTNVQRFGVDSSILFNKQSKISQLHLKRTISLSNSGRLKSVCRINGKHVSLKTLRQVAAPLFTRVDVGVASAALGRPASRLAMLDMGVPESVMQNCAQLRDTYKEARKRTKSIRRDLESRILPSSLQGNINNEGFDEEQRKLLEHWLDELDSFETRITRFQEALLAQYNELLSDESNAKNGSGSSGIVKILQKLQMTAWMQHTESDDDSLFTNLLDFREEMKAVEAQLVSAQLAYESLASLTAPNSALVALENTRKLLYSISSDHDGPLFETIEKTHELLNGVEASLDGCARSIDGNSNSLMSTLEKMVFTGISAEEVDIIISDWNAMARKHGISPYSLPNCHMSIREELDGNVEALKLLPEAEEDERIALEDYSHACKELSDARKEVAFKLSESVSKMLPSLGMEGSTLQVQLSLRPGGFEEPYYGPENTGVDIADFMLLHQQSTNENDEDVDALGAQHGGNIEQVGSSGEKSRVLLAIETALPGSIGSTCNSFSNSAESVSQGDLKIPPISIIYDEIDAHVGGRAVVTMAKLLSDQSRTRRPLDNEKNIQAGSQIIAITHSASLAAIADRHIVVERGLNRRWNFLPIRTYVVDGSSRRKEIARMTSGDLASGEAETFADALIRDALLHKEMTSS